MSARGFCIVLLGLVAACSRPGGKPKADAETSAPAAMANTPATKTAPGPAADAGKALPKVIEDDDLKVEESDGNPYSETVTLKLSVTPQVKATVHWGAKVLARLEPGKMEAEITRPRGSGPLDLEIKAEGYMPYHTRLYTGRNDKLGIRLYRPEEAPSIFGYKRSAEGKKAEAEKQEKQR